MPYGQSCTAPMNWNSFVHAWLPRNRASRTASGCAWARAARQTEPRKSSAQFRREAEQVGKGSLVAGIKCTGCHGFCERGPLVVVDPGNIFYQCVKEEDVAEIWRETVLAGRVVERLLYKDQQTGRACTTAEEIPFYGKQCRIVLVHNGVIDPTRIEEYLAVGGYSGLAKALGAMAPEDIIAEITRSGLRGRGGGGFPTGKKWRFARRIRREQIRGS